MCLKNNTQINGKSGNRMYKNEMIMIHQINKTLMKELTHVK